MRRDETKNHKLCSEEEVFEHANNDEYSIVKRRQGPEVRTLESYAVREEKEKALDYTNLS
jgi:hypothetical protein